LKIPLVAEFGTDHIKKTEFVISASIFSENVEGMKLKIRRRDREKSHRLTTVAILVRFSVFWR